jgi:tryptophan synthase beta chain
MKVMHVMHHVLRPNAAARRAFAAIACDSVKVPKAWYNIQADLKVPLPPPLHPGELRPCLPDDFAPLFPMSLIQQEISTERYIDIPEPVREVLELWRPSPLFRASRWEKALKLPQDVKIFYKYEGGSPSGSHKTNTAVAQIFYNKEAGTKKVTTETGAGQWGSALAFSGAQFDLPVEVYQVKVSYEQKPYRKAFIETCGAQIYPSPSHRTQYGAKVLQEDPACPGSLGIAISEAIEACVTSGGTAKYALGSVLSHVLMHQTVIGLEAIEQMEISGESPDVVVGCTGGGSNFAGITFPFLGQKLRGERNKIRFVAVEPAACPSLTKGVYAYDFGDTAQMTPLIKAHTLGAAFIPPKVHSGGLRYHAMAPLISHLKELGELEARAVPQSAAFQAGASFFQSEGILPAPEATHAIEGALAEAKDAASKGEPRSILFNMCGHGHFDMAAWQKWSEGQLEDFDYPDELVQEALKSVPGLNGVDWPMPSAD